MPTESWRLAMPVGLSRPLGVPGQCGCSCSCHKAQPLSEAGGWDTGASQLSDVPSLAVPLWEVLRSLCNKLVPENLDGMKALGL